MTSTPGILPSLWLDRAAAPLAAELRTLGFVCTVLPGRQAGANDALLREACANRPGHPVVLITDNMDRYCLLDRRAYGILELHGDLLQTLPAGKLARKIDETVR